MNKRQRTSSYGPLVGAAFPISAQQVSEDVIAIGALTRPKGTLAQYRTRQRKWREWCATKHFPTGDLVTPSNLLLFIYEYVLLLDPSESSNRPRGACTPSDGIPNIDVGREEDEEDEEDSEDDDDLSLASVDLSLLDSALYQVAPVPIPTNDRIAQIFRRLRQCRFKPQSIENYISAIIDLWKTQRALGANTHQNPRSGHISTLMGAFRAVSHARDKALYVDKGKHTVHDGYANNNQFSLSIESYFKRSTFSGMRDMAAAMFGTYGLMRGDNQRRLTLSDLGSQLLPPTEGPTPCPVILAIMREGKTNHKGLMQYCAMMRASDVFVCPVWGLASYFFARFHRSAQVLPHSMTTFPSFEERSHWYDLPVLCHEKSPTKPVSYHTQANAVRNALHAAAVDSSKTTHAGRKYGAQLAENGGVSYEEIARAGGWATGVMETTYLSRVPRQAVRAISGFPKEGGSFYLPRAVDVPEELQRKVFPEVERWLSYLEENAASDLSPSKKKRAASQKRDIAGKAFLKLLKTLRGTFLQDVVHWRTKYPDHYLWNDPIFSDALYLRYEENAKLQAEERLHQLPYDLKASNPRMCDILETMSNAHLQNQRNLTAQLQSIDTQMRLLATHHGLSEQSMGVIVKALAEPRMIVVPPLLPSARLSADSDTHTDAATPGLPPSTAFALTHDHQLVPKFEMSRHLKSVVDLWREWSEGLNGRPAVQAVYGVKGYRFENDSERRFYDGRRKIISVVERVAVRRGIPHFEAAQAVEQWRIRTGCNSLNALKNKIKDVADIPLYTI